MNSLLKKLLDCYLENGKKELVRKLFSLTLTNVSFLMSFSLSPVIPCVSQIKGLQQVFFKIGAKRLFLGVPT